MEINFVELKMDEMQVDGLVNDDYDQKADNYE